MENTMTSDRKSLIRLASTLPKGSKERKAILAGLKKVAKKYRPDTNAYIRSAGAKCPFCGSDDLEHGELVRCGNCEARWADVTKITGIEVAVWPEPVEDLEEPPAKGSPMSKGAASKGA
jgi:hypothetical protein